MWDEELNSSIDEIARQMTDLPAAGDADFCRRVLARIDSGEAPRRNWRAEWVLAPMAVAMAIVIAIVAARRPGPAGPAGPKGPALQAGTESTVAAPGPTPGDPARPKGPDLWTPTKTAAGTARRPGPFGPGVPLGTGAPAPNGSAPEIAVLDVLPLTVDSIPMPAIVTESIQLQKLDATAPIGVTPLGSPSEGDRP